MWRLFLLVLMWGLSGVGLAQNPVVQAPPSKEETLPTLPSLPRLPDMTEAVAMDETEPGEAEPTAPGTPEAPQPNPPPVGIPGRAAQNNNRFVRPAPNPPPEERGPVAPAPGSGLLPDNAHDWEDVYKAMLDSKSFEPRSGHAIAASLVTTCLGGGKNATEKAAAIWDLREALKKSRIQVTRNFISRNPNHFAVTMLAATLACKPGDRTPAQLVTDLDQAYIELYTTKKIEWGDYFQYVIIAASLML